MNNKTEYISEYDKIKRMRSIDKLKDRPFDNWRKIELVDFIEHYKMYFNENRDSDNLCNIEEFLKFGIYKRYFAEQIEQIKK